MLVFGEDRLSALSDDILLSIISRLPFVEASATSILSTRWRHLRTYRLDFPPLIFKQKIRFPHHVNMIGRTLIWHRILYDIYDAHLAKLSLPHHLNMIDRTLDSYQAHHVEELRVNMTDYTTEANIQKWLLFALTKRAQTIEIILTRAFIPNLTEPRPTTNYSLGLANLISWQPAAAAGLACLKELSLRLIEVTDHDLELLLSNCLALESLSLQLCRNFRRVSIVGHPNLKHLDLSHSLILESFEILDVINLVSLKCSIWCKCAVKLENIPKLIEFSSDENFCCMFIDFLLKEQMPSCVRDQLQLLHLSTRLENWPSLPFEFANVKHLELEVDNYRETRDLTGGLPRFIEACPSLEKLVIKLWWWSSDSLTKTSRERLPPEYEKSKLPTHFEELRRRSSVKRMRPCVEYKELSSSLKELEIAGYLRSPSTLGLATYLIKKAAASLQRVIVVPWDSSYTNRMRAQQDFQSITPASAHLEIKDLIDYTS